MKSFFRVFLGIGIIATGLGIALLIIAAGTGAGFRHIATYSFEDTYEGVQSLDISINYGDVSIVEGDVFGINAEKLYQDDELNSYVTDGVWVVKQSENNRFRIFGIDIPTVSVFKEDYLPVITITIPKGFQAEDIQLDLSAGRLEADRMKAKTGTFMVDAGKLAIHDLEVADQSDFKVGAGYMSLSRIRLNNTKVDCGVGSIRLEGVIHGDNEISCGVGSVSMDLEGIRDNYAYDIDSGIGNAIINGRSYHNNTIRKKSGDSGDGSFYLKSGIGNITLDIY